MAKPSNQKRSKRVTLQEFDLTARKAAQQYQGDFALPTVVTGLCIFTAYAATPLAVFVGALPLWTGCLLMIVLAYAAYTILHDAAHGAISGSHASLRWVNEWMGYAAAFVLMIPLTAHRHEHLAHHRHTNNGAEDPDLVVSDMTRSPLHTLRAAGRIYIGQYRYYMRNRWKGLGNKQDRQFIAEIVIAITARVALMAQGFWLEGFTLFAVGGIGGVALLMYLFAYIVHRPHDAQGRYVDTATIIAPTWCNRLVTWGWLFQNYHSIHHLFPRIPFYRYRRLFDEIEPAMRAHGAPIYRLTATGLRPLPT